MCGRFVVARANADLLPLFEIDSSGSDLPEPSYNIAPTHRIPVILDSLKTEQRRLESARWGLVPPFKKSLKDGPTPFNARVEKLGSSGMYRGAFSSRRAIIPASGFFERRKLSDLQSFYITPADGSVLAFAGLYEWWRDPADSSWLLSATIVTHPPQGQMTEVHDREPLYLDDTMLDAWLDPTEPGDEGLLAAVAESSAEVAAGLEFREVGDAWLSTAKGQYVNSPELIEPAPKGAA
ncbi:SOS response-associated peptidase [Agrococcus casei]|uniref:SOS response-associated peptidase n=1 Tax=Agrococcus casei TaxID=343512 RepID=UPI003F8DD766